MLHYRIITLALLLLLGSSTILSAQRDGSNKPDPGFYRHFRCQSVVQKPGRVTLATYFTSQRVKSYRFDRRVITRGRDISSYPIFKALDARHKPFETQINRFIRQILEEYSTLLSDSESHDHINYEIVVANENFVSIHLTVSLLSRYLSYYSTSFNYDLRQHKRLTNCELLARLGVSDAQFEKAMRARWPTLAILAYENKYPAFEEVQRNSKLISRIDGIFIDKNDYRNFDELLRDASILPVIHHQTLYLRLGFWIGTGKMDLIGYADWPLPIPK